MRDYYRRFIYMSRTDRLREDIMRIYVTTISRPGYRDVQAHREEISARLYLRERAEAGYTTVLSVCWLPD